MIAENIKLGAETNYDQDFKDIRVNRIELKLRDLSNQQQQEFILELYSRIETETPVWFENLLEDIQLVVPLKKESDRTIGKNTKVNLLKIIFGIYSTRKEYIQILDELFPLYEFEYQKKTNQFISESTNQSFRKFLIRMSPRYTQGFPSHDFVALMHEIAHSINASQPYFRTKEQEDNIDKINRFGAQSGTVTFLTEFLSDLTAMLLSNKESIAGGPHEIMRIRAWERITGSSERLYPQIERNLKYYWEFKDLTHLVPANLIVIGQISRKIPEILAECAKKSKTAYKPKDVVLSDEDERMILEAFIQYLTEVKEGYTIITENDNLDEHDEYIKKHANYARTKYYSEGADMVQTVLDNVMNK